MEKHRLCKDCGHPECAVAGKDGMAYCGDFIPATNAGLIRSMTDEDLAKTLGKFASGNVWDILCGNPERKTICNNECESCTLEWLKRECDSYTP